MIFNNLNRLPTEQEYNNIYKEIIQEFPETEQIATLQDIKSDNYIKILYGDKDNVYGVAVFAVADKTLYEVILYIRKDKRKSLKSVMKMIKDMPSIARDYGCDYVRAGASLGNPELMQRVYKSAGFKTTDIRMIQCVGMN